MGNATRAEKKCLEFQCAFTKAIGNLVSARHLLLHFRRATSPLSAAILKNYAESTLGTSLFQALGV